MTLSAAQSAHTIRCFALRPLSIRPVTLSGIPLPSLDRATGRYGPETVRTLTAIDPEPWARAFLADADKVFEPASLSAIERAAPEMLAALAASRRAVTDAIAAGLDVVLATDGDDGLAEARAGLRERLSSGLAKAYAEPAVVQVCNDAGGSPTRVPKPLRDLPAPPRIPQQAARAPVAPSSLAKAVVWSYGLTLQYPAANQDQVTIGFAPDAPPVSRVATGPLGLFEALARYDAVATDLRELLADLTATPGPATIGALETWTGLVGEIAEAWTAHWRAAPDAAPTHDADTPGFVIGFEPAPDGTGSLAALTLARTGAGATFDWPEIRLPDIASVVLRPSDPAAGIRTYPLPAALIDAALATVELAFPGLTIARHPALTATVRLERNARLLGLDGPTSRPGFIYDVVTAAAAPVLPFISSDVELDIGPWSDDLATCPLVAAIKTLNDGAATDPLLRLDVEYVYQPVDGPVTTAAKVLLAGPTSSPDMPAEVVAAMVQWREDHQPSTDGAFWRFGITVFADSPGARPTPLLTLTNLVSPVAPGEW